MGLAGGGRGTRGEGRDQQAGSELQREGRRGDVLSRSSRDSWAETARLKTAPAQATRPPGGCGADTSNRQRRVREASGHVQPELTEKTVPPLGECPPPERGRPPGPHRRQPAPGPSPSPPRGRAPVAPGKLAPRAREGLGPTPGQATVPPGTWTLNAIVRGRRG